MKPTSLLSAWMPALAGAFLLALAGRSGLVMSSLVVAPASLLLAGGVRILLFPDVRGPQHIAIGAALGIILSPLALFAGLSFGIAMLALSFAAFLASGWIQIRLQPAMDGVPAPPPHFAYAAQIAVDNLVLGLISLVTPIASRTELDAARDETDIAFSLFADRGWLANPASFHQAPPAAEAVELSPLRLNEFALERLTFASGYDPDAAMPGRDRWLAYQENRTAHAHILRHGDGARRWVVCIHGAGMGADPKMDFNAFHVDKLHHRFGLNVALFILPVHGPRSPSKPSGAKFFGASALDFIHAQAQAIWDLRRLIGWIRRQGGTEVGIFGISLGGYTSALLSSVERDLSFVIACVPTSDMASLSDDLASMLERRSRAAACIDAEKVRALYSVVSPLSLPSRVEKSRRLIYAATGDQFAPAEQALALWRHWERPAIDWCVGGHVSAIFLQRRLRSLIDQALSIFARDERKPPLEATVLSLEQGS